MPLPPTENEARPHAEALALARRCADGDPAARRKVAESLFERVRTTVRYISANDRDRDDWVQLAMIEILASLHGYRGDSSLEAWSDRITIRTAMRHLKRRKKREERVVLVEDPRPARKADEGDVHDRMMVRRRVASLLGGIDHHCRVAVVLKLVHGYSVDEIAGMTGAPRDTVKGRLKRGRRQLREKIGRDSWLMDWARAGEI